MNEHKVVDCPLYSIGKVDHVHAPNISFHNVGLWGDDITDRHGWKLQKLSTIRSNLRHQSVRASLADFIRHLNVCSELGFKHKIGFKSNKHAK